MKWPSLHVNGIPNQKVIPVWNSRRCEFSRVNTPLDRNVHSLLTACFLLAKGSFIISLCFLYYCSHFIWYSVSTRTKEEGSTSEQKSHKSADAEEGAVYVSLSDQRVRSLRWCFTGQFATTIFMAAIVEQCCTNSSKCRNNAARLCCAGNRRCELPRVTSPFVETAVHLCQQLQ